MLNLTIMTWVFCSYLVVMQRKTTNIQSLLSRSFVCSEKSRHCWVFFSAGLAGQDQAESESSGH